MATGNPFVGSWRYRSWRNLPQEFGDDDKVGPYLMGQAIITINESKTGTFTGVLDMGEDKTGKYVLELKGSTVQGTPLAVRFQGVGTQGPVKGWVYDYIGYMIPNWPNGVDQVPAFVGSVIRTVEHGDPGKSPAGYSGSFICVRIADGTTS